MLQQGQAVPVWGSADAGESILVRFAEQVSKPTILNLCLAADASANILNGMATGILGVLA
ncbi:MAG: hypothetical protein L3J39_10970 [Verrucomicrobiales bacterium]|nr:hypothetical protein [Verrucomicrobiales bacterium]